MRPVVAPNAVVRSNRVLKYACLSQFNASGPKPCSGTLIKKGELRMGSLVDVHGNKSLYVQSLSAAILLANSSLLSAIVVNGAIGVVLQPSSFPNLRTSSNKQTSLMDLTS